MRKYWKSLTVLGVLILSTVSILSRGVSSQGMPSESGSIQVCEGYSWFHDRVRFLIVREWPGTWTEQQRLNEPNVRWTALGGRQVLIPGKGWQSAKSDGSVYLFGKDGLRTMRVDANNHSDLFEMGRCRTTDDIWEFLQQYRVDK